MDSPGFVITAMIAMLIVFIISASKHEAEMQTKCVEKGGTYMHGERMPSWCAAKGTVIDLKQ